MGLGAQRRKPQNHLHFSAVHERFHLHMLPRLLLEPTGGYVSRCIIVLYTLCLKRTVKPPNTAALKTGENLAVLENGGKGSHI